MLALVTSDSETPLQRRALVMGAFSPSQPITDKTLFAGRLDQMRTLLDVIFQAGQHAVIYGERGVGKTSLSRVIKQVVNQSYWTADYTCSSADTFGSIWREVLRSFPVTEQRPPTGFSSAGQSKSTTTSLVSMLEKNEPSPNDVRRCLELIAEVDSAVIFIDEFDRPKDPSLRGLFADTVKILSDQGIQVTIVLVGVADTVDDLIAGHNSIQRALVQVQMPRMAIDELKEIVSQGMQTAQLDVTSEFVDRVVELSQGLPHYTHLLSQYGGVATVERGSREVSAEDLSAAIMAALRNVSQTVRDKYHSATFSNRETLYRQVLLACALANKDDLGTFSASDVRERLQEITERNYDIPAFANHLTDFSSTDGPRGRVLIKRGVERRFRYRFVDPLLPPYIVMKGTADHLIVM
jgi:Cdc6-like AAA superfamily ATPase